MVEILVLKIAISSFILLGYNHYLCCLDISFTRSIHVASFTFTSVVGDVY